MSGWSNSKNYTISVIDKKKYGILKKRNRNKKVKFFKSIDDINNKNNFDYIIFATRPLELTNVFKELSIKKRFVKFTNLFLKFYWLTSVFVKIPGSSAGAFEFEFNSVAA